MSREHALVSLDTRLPGDTESGGFRIPGPASSHRQTFQASYLLASREVATQQMFHLL